jgi:site-specific DNA-methyltransferase (cytosine-N4-specific)
MSAIIYKTKFGKAYYGDSLDILRRIDSKSIDLVITSPPFALRRKKSYGNVSADKYSAWIWPFLEEIHRILKPRGSLVLDIGGSWNNGKPTRSLYHFELLTEICSESNLFKLAQEFYWYNPAKMPAPAQWVTIERIRVKDAVNPIWWLSKSSRPKASNRRVLKPYTKSMENLLKKGYNEGPRPSGHNVSNKWGKRQKGAIPPNIIIASNTRSSDDYIRACKEYGIEINPARFAKEIPEFFIKFLSMPGDIVLDPFCGSNVVGRVAETLNRKWISIDIRLDYIVGSSFRFNGIGKSTYERFKRSL